MGDQTARTADRLEASRLLAERGWGKPTLPLAAVEPVDHEPVADVERWPSPERMLELATLYRETGEADKALAFEVWANDALAAGARIDQPIDPAIAPAPTVARVATGAHRPDRRNRLRDQTVALCVAHTGRRGVSVIASAARSGTSSRLAGMGRVGIEATTLGLREPRVDLGRSGAIWLKAAFAPSGRRRVSAGLGGSGCTRVAPHQGRSLRG